MLTLALAAALLAGSQPHYPPARDQDFTAIVAKARAVASENSQGKLTIDQLNSRLASLGTDLHAWSTKYGVPLRTTQTTGSATQKSNYGVVKTTMGSQFSCDPTHQVGNKVCVLTSITVSSGTNSYTCNYECPDDGDGKKP